MNEIEEARRKERLDQLKLIPLALIIFAMIIGIYVVFLSDEIVFDGVAIWGASKSIWFLCVLVLVGLSVVSFVFSLSFLIFLGRAAKYMNKRAHPWKPVVFSGKLLVLGYSFLALGAYLEFSVRDNINYINNWYEYWVGEGFLHYILGIAWLIGVVQISALLLSFIVQGLLLPFNVGKTISEFSSNH